MTNEMEALLMRAITVRLDYRECPICGADMEARLPHREECPLFIPEQLAKTEATPIESIKLDASYELKLIQNDLRSAKARTKKLIDRGHALHWAQLFIDRTLISLDDEIAKAIKP